MMISVVYLLYMLKEIGKEALRQPSFTFRELEQLLSWPPRQLLGHFTQLGTFLSKKDYLKGETGGKSGKIRGREKYRGHGRDRQREFPVLS